MGVWAPAANPFAATQFLRIPKFKPFAAKPLTAKLFPATFLPLAALTLTPGHLQKNRTLSARMGHSKENQGLAASGLFR